MANNLTCFLSLIPIALKAIGGEIAHSQMLNGFQACEKFHSADHELYRPNTAISFLRKVSENSKPEVRSIAARLSSLPLDDSRRQVVSELLAIQLNRELAPPKDTFSKELVALWNRYRDPKTRAPISLDRADECIQEPDPIFQQFAAALRRVIHLGLEDRTHLSSGLSQNLQVLPMLPAGTKAFFGATVNLGNSGRPRICVNPEEAPPLLVAKISHEMVHATNSALMERRQRFTRLVSQWHQQTAALAQIEEALIEFDDRLIDSENGGFDSIIDALPESWLTDAEQKAAKKTIMRKLGAASFRMDKDGRDQAKLLETWGKFLGKKVELGKSAATIAIERRILDQERFLDEHRAYLVSLKVAYSLVASEPEFFCTLWVPSFAARRPVPFFAAYLPLEARIKSGRLSQWLAETYVGAKLYLPSSIYQPGSDKILPALLARGANIVKTSLESANAPRPKVESGRDSRDTAGPRPK